MKDSNDLNPLIELLRFKLNSGSAFSEYELMRWLQEPEQGVFRADALAHPLTLFQSHFILMHALYCLKKQWLQQNTAVLDISALHIQKRAWPEHVSNETEINTFDPLMDYYLDLAQLKTTEEEVEQLLNSFWLKMRLPEQQPEDLAILELAPPVTAQQIKKQYRKLAMQHHPDRGGNEQMFCRVQSAYQRLRIQFS